MDAQPAVEPPPSPMKNMVGGSGCGCGCLGALSGLLGMILLAGIQLQFYEGEVQWVWIAGTGTIAIGLLTALVGVAMWVGSLFMD